MRWNKVFSKTGLLAVMLVVIGIGIFFYERQYCGAEQPARYETQQLRQVITADSKTSRTIMWQTAAPESDAWVEYRLQGGQDIQKTAAQGKEFATDAGTVYQQSVTLTGLEPASVYEYRAGSGKEFSDWHTLQTDGGGAFSALIFGDSQSLDYNVWRQTASAAYANDKAAAFFINMGDLVDNGEQYSQWRSWFRGAAGLLPQIPVAPISGNHENYSLQWKPYKGDLYLTLFDLTLNGPEGLPKQAYSYDYGEVHFAVIDTQLEELKDWQPDLVARQVKWLENDLAASNKKWKVVLVHRSLFRYQDGKQNELGAALLPVLDRSNVDVVFSAHIHTYGRTAPLKNGNVAGQGTVYISSGRSGDKTWAGSRAKPQEVVFDNVLDQPNYMKQTADSHKLTVTSLKQDGKLIDTMTLTK
ncbi:metallophosphoesterase [Phascolarctobacterium sp.]